MPANENRISLLSKWLWAIATRERASMLITGHPNQHLAVDVGLVPVEAPASEATQPTETTQTSAPMAG
jgi:NADH dehydrogenase